MSGEQRHRQGPVPKGRGIWRCTCGAPIVGTGECARQMEEDRVQNERETKRFVLEHVDEFCPCCGQWTGGNHVKLSEKG